MPDGLRPGETRLRLQTIVRLRWLAVLGQSLTVIGAYWVLGIDLPIGLCLAVIALAAWLNVALRIRYPASQRLKSSYAFAMLGFDVIVPTRIAVAHIPDRVELHESSASQWCSHAVSNWEISACLETRK